MKLSILIAAYNEERTIHQILDKIRDVILINNTSKEIIIVNDCSSDNTVAKLLNNTQIANPEMDIQLYNQEKNQEKVLPYTKQ